VKIDELAITICEAIGVEPSNVAALDIELRPGNLATVRITHTVVSLAEADALVAAISEYRLFPKGEAL
jgi:hypothetical protein